MWTEREKYLSSVEEIKTYIEQMDYFHDHRIGNIRYNGTEATITVEEIVDADNNAETAGNIWDFVINGIVKIQMDCDCAFTYFLNEITLEEELVFNCTNGYIAINAEMIKLGIPS